MNRLGLILSCVAAVAAVDVVRAGDGDSFPFRIPPGWTARKFADHPMLGNPVAFCLDEKGRVFVAEEYRFNRGTEENRTRPFLLEDDLQIKTLDDRLAMYRKHASKFEGGMDWFTKHADQVRLVEDTDGDGKADRSVVFAGGFNGVLDGLAAGVIARDGDVYLTCIPSLWRLRDRDGDGKAESREALLTGFGVNAGFLGHDLHGLVWGPDGRLYFSVGDRGFHVKTKEGGLISGPRRGGVFRCEPDGSRLELVAQGMRNPQELAFDAYGNLFAADNNCDKGDDARLVLVVEGGDSGWNMAYQTIPSPYLTGPWHAEKLWHLAHPGQAAYIVPPIGKLGAGPSGFAAYPGVGLPSRYVNHLFYCNFTGNGGVEAFGVRPRGASFEMFDVHQVITPVLASDVDFGYDGLIYFTDYGKLEWDGSNNDGRIYTVESPARGDASDTAGLFQEGFNQRTAEDLITLLSHPDQRVRQRAQFALAERAEESVVLLANVVHTSTRRFPRLHAIWALGQIARRGGDRSVLRECLEDRDSVARVVTIKILGELKDDASRDRIIERLRDGDDHVRFEAAIALGRMNAPNRIEPILAMLRENDDRDAYLRHAGVMGLLGAGGRPAVDRLIRYRNDPSRSVRLALVLVCRRTRDARVAEFLADADLLVQTEAARAIHDLEIDEAEPALARILPGVASGQGEASYPLIRRSLNANLRVGGASNAEAVAAFASDPSRPLEMRREAIAVLSSWTSPSRRDRVNGFWRDLGTRDKTVVRDAAAKYASRLTSTAGAELLPSILELIERSEASVDLAPYRLLVADSSASMETRVASLRLLASRKDPELDRLIGTALKSEHPLLRAEARRRLAEIDPRRAFELLRRIILDANANLVERREALDVASGLTNPAVDSLLVGLLEQTREGKMTREFELDVLEAAATRKSKGIDSVLRSLAELTQPGDPLEGFRPTLVGGDPDRGRSVFVDNPRAQCVRCHRVANQGGTAGPNLSEVGKRLKREDLLLSLLNPDAVIAPGFGRASLALADGRIVAGVIKSENAEFVEIETAGGRIERIKVADIEERTPPKSPMPGAREVLSRKELRDLIAFLATLN